MNKKWKISAKCATNCRWKLYAFRIGDNNSNPISLASNPVFHARTKHVEIDYHYIRELVLANLIKVHFVCSQDQLADIHTKSLSKSCFAALKSKLPLVSSIDPKLSLRGFHHERAYDLEVSSLQKSFENWRLLSSSSSVCDNNLLYIAREILKKKKIEVDVPYANDLLVFLYVTATAPFWFFHRT
ncbi:hypothetical protein DVH24_042388 [Malus domestica]|uniref:Reverse transcriptase Ty1/copia-type domain-containing protein n=1 Tax=Malus domestica TaxID=3750 RepID=A0A498J186_MALDO|nr:hypothetical protein DVH24_042388 [Malus domestica]